MTTQQLRWYGVPEGEALEIGDCQHERIRTVTSPIKEYDFSYCLDCWQTLDDKYHKETP